MHLNYAEIHTDTLEEAFQSKKQPGEKKFHNLKYIEKVAELSADALADNIRSGGSTNDNSTTIYTVSDLYSLVKRLDEDFTVTHEVNSALLNEDGTPKVFYHGTNSSDFTVFDSSKSNKRVRLNVLGEGYYFSA